MRYFVYKPGNQGAEITKEEYEKNRNVMKKIPFGKKPSTRILLKSK